MSFILISGKSGAKDRTTSSRFALIVSQNTIEKGMLVERISIETKMEPVDYIIIGNVIFRASDVLEAIAYLEGTDPLFNACVIDSYGKNGGLYVSLQEMLEKSEVLRVNSRGSCYKSVNYKAFCKAVEDALENKGRVKFT